MQRQFDILDELAQVAFIASKGEYDMLILEVEVNVEEGWIKGQCTQVLDGVTEQLSLFGIRDPDLLDMSFELHKEMKNHTGGDLKKYEIKINRESEALADFEYRNEPPKGSAADDTDTP